MAALQYKKAEKTGLASGGICDLIIGCFLFGTKSGFANWGRGREEKKVGVRTVGSETVPCEAVVTTPTRQGTSAGLIGYI